ncbi:MAG: hypothetical protein RL274_1604 [Pseudomonadota bacterium]|jgi:HPt (histidine-containing phosphotransfer) domain-containing protein
MNNPASRRPSLRDRISGPNAVDITSLVARGEAASQLVQDSFDDFLRLRVRTLEGMQDKVAGNPADDDAWNGFFTIVRDIRGSSALAGKPLINAICATFETLLRQRDPNDPRMRTAIAPHICALDIVLSVHGEEDQRLLAEQLARAVDCLPVTQRNF